MPEPIDLQFAHMGIYVTDLAKMADFYHRVMGFPITDEGPPLNRPVSHVVPWRSQKQMVRIHAAGLPATPGQPRRDRVEVGQSG